MILFLDVDGVIAPVTKVPPEHWGDWEECRDAGVSVLLSQRMADALTSLGCTIKWLTTWEGMANCLADVFGWGVLEVVPRKGCNEDPWWKLDALLRQLTDDEPFIWCDDDIWDERFAVTDALGARALVAPRMMLSPDPFEGLTPALVAQMREFVERHG